MVDLQKIGEFGFISHLMSVLAHPTGAGLVGIGDDCAVIPQSDGVLLVTKDLLVEDVHFRRATFTGEQVGRKAIAVNVSDIAAMGGEPLYCFVGLSIPPQLDPLFLEGLVEGINLECRKYGLTVLGGDTTRSTAQLFVSITVIGRAYKPIYRSSAKVGDKVFVTGDLGQSGLGLALLERGLNQGSHTRFTDYQTTPTARLREGIFLANQEGVNAMMDISDGIGSDLERICQASKVGIRVDVAAIPCSQDAATVASTLDLDMLDLAINAGEDYELICIIAADHADRCQQDYQKQFGVPLYEIGVVTSTGILEFHDTSGKWPLNVTGFRHFESP